jgi:CheY-like chemotaxis protein
MSALSDKLFSVLVADDAESDRLLLKTAMRYARRLQIVGEVADGAQTIAYLKGHADFRDRQKFPFPDLLLLDLKMPRLGGFEVLEWLGSQPFTNLNVVVLTDSMEPAHIKRALDLGADLFQMKPRTKHERETMIHALEDYLTTAALKSVYQVLPEQLRATSRIARSY